MINLEKSLNDFNILCSGVIHVGGHKAQEYYDYKNAGLVHQIWIEANPKFFYEILYVIRNDYNCSALNFAVYDEEKEIKFWLASNGASSSILPLKNHLKYYPDIDYNGFLEMTTKRLDKIIDEYDIDLTKHDGLVMDVQGVELSVLKSLGFYLSKFKFVLTEINLEELYEGCCLVNELDEYLKKYGFERKITDLWEDGAAGWGDALYIKNK